MFSIRARSIFIGTPALALWFTWCLVASSSPLQAQVDARAAATGGIEGHKQLLRYYRFSGSAGATDEIVSRGDQAVALRVPRGQALQWAADTGRSAVQLDASWLESDPVPLGEQGFTAEIRFRKQGPGRELGNGRRNGMLMSQGSGYWDGWRVWASSEDMAVRFEVGRAQPDHAFGISSAGELPDGVWHHVAISWDGTQMRLYVNGTLAAAAAYAGDYVPPRGLFKIGYAGQGIGSLRMDVQEVAIFRGALPAVEVLAHALNVARISPTVAGRLEQATQAVIRQDLAVAESQFAELAALRDVSVGEHFAVELARVRLLRQLGQMGASMQLCSQVAQDAEVPAALRAIALRHCVPSRREQLRDINSASVYQQLLQLPDLSPHQRLLCDWGLAECLLAENQPLEAREHFQRVLGGESLTDLERQDVQLQAAHCLLQAGQFAAARDAYSQLVSGPAADGPLPALAGLSMAVSWQREGKYREAYLAFTSVSQSEAVPRHLRDEATQRAAEMLQLQRGQPLSGQGNMRRTLPQRPSPGLTIHVAPGGDDANSGTRQRPLASLSGARDLIRRRRTADGSLPPGGVEVVVADGTYAQRSTLVLAVEDSATEESPIVYRAAAGATPRFSGGQELRGFQPVTDPAVLARLEPSVRMRVVAVDLGGQGIDDYGAVTQRGYGRAAFPVNPWTDLYVAGRPLRLARWPNQGWLEIGPVAQGRIGTSQSTAPGVFAYPGTRPQRWRGADDIWMFGAWGHLWEGTSLQVARLDRARHQVTTRQRATYGFREGYPFYFFNVLEELDQPGEWYLDRPAGRLYVLPPEEMDGAALVAEFPLLDQPMVLLREANHVTLQGLTFELGRTDAIVIQSGRANRLAGCRVRRFGGNAVVIQGGADHGVLGCDLETLGAGGVRMAGGDYRTLTPAGHFVENCHIHDFSRVDRVYAPAVHVDGVGNHVAHNLIHDSPHHAMRVEGFEHVIEFNEVHSVVYEYDDQAGIDIYGNPAYRGLVIRHNFWHHIGSGYDVAGQAGVRLDDFISSVLIYGNVFYRCAGGRFGGVQIHGGKDNIADNNLFIDCQAAVSFSSWGQQRWLDRLQDPRTQQTLRRDGMDITTPPHSERYPDLASLESHPDRNFLLRNVTVNCEQFTLRDRGVNELLDNHAFSGDVGFADAAGGDFTLAGESPVYKRFPFRPIPFAEIGLYQDAYRATWPVTHHVTSNYVDTRPAE